MMATLLQQHRHTPKAMVFYAIGGFSFGWWLMSFIQWVVK